MNDKGCCCITCKVFLVMLSVKVRGGISAA